MDTSHPNPQPNPHHRKIDLQSPLDLLYLQRNLSTAATQKLDLHFPPKHAYATHIPLGPQPQSQTQEEQVQTDPMRQRVSELVTAFIRETWDGAKQGISVNGMDAVKTPDLFNPEPSSTSTNPQDPSVTEAETEREGIDFTYTPYDANLSSKLASLYAEVESLTSTVSNLRRTNPRSGAEAYLSTLEQSMGRDETFYQARSAEAARQPTELLKIQNIPSDAPELYERGLAGLAGLSGLKTRAGQEGGNANGRKQSSLTETVGKVQRARRVVRELE